MTGQTIIIAGSGRCGTSMMMQMLHAAGVPTIGTWPDFECFDTLALLETQPERFIEAIQGKAVKVLDPHRYRLPDFGEATAIWMKRNVNEQARSTIKFVNSLRMGPPVEDNRAKRRQITRNLRAERRIAPRLLQERVTKIGHIDFETIIENPRAFAHVLCEYLGLDVTLAERMAQCVVKRGPECLPYMLEAQQIVAAEAVEDRRR